MCSRIFLVNRFQTFIWFFDNVWHLVLALLATRFGLPSAYTKDIRRNGNVEKWYNFIAFAGAPLPMRYYRSSLCLKILYEEFTVGPATVYSTVGKTLETLANTNWSSLVQTDERRDVTQISETCLEICLSGFQIEAAIKWIQSLMTEEIKK